MADHTTPEFPNGAGRWECPVCEFAVEIGNPTDEQGNEIGWVRFKAPEHPCGFVAPLRSTHTVLDREPRIPIWRRIRAALTRRGIRHAS